MITHPHRPNFLIIGAAKAGTTALYHYLNQHPQIFLTPLKETNFFALAGQKPDFRGPGDNHYVNTQSLTNWDSYLAQFDTVTDEIAIGEASPLYLYHPDAAERIRFMVPDVKLIAVLRNPVDRAFSAFVHLVRDHRETTRDFAEALSLEDERIRANWEHIWHYQRMGLYYEQVKRYYDHFPREQIKIDLYRDLRLHLHDLLRDNARFLGVDDGFQFDTKRRYNEASIPIEERPHLYPEVHEQLQNAFRDDIGRLEELIGEDLSHWLQPWPHPVKAPELKAAA